MGSFQNTDINSIVNNHQRISTLASDNLVRLFLKDVAQIPIIHGRSTYLPLTRRIQRYLVAREYIDEPSGQLLLELPSIVEQALSDLKHQVQRLNLPPMDVAQLAQQIDAFIDSPEQKFPPALRRYFSLLPSYNIDAIELGWKGFYLLSLLPPTSRLGMHSSDDVADLRAYLFSIQSEGLAAQKRLIEGTLRYVIKVAYLYSGRGIPFLELVDEGLFGLARATETFREYLGTHFQAHATTWISQKIRRYFANHGTLIRLPIHRLDTVQLMREFALAFESKWGDLPYEVDFNHLFVGKGKKAYLTYYDMVFTPPYSFEDSGLKLPMIDDEEADLADYLIDDQPDHLPEERMQATALVEIIHAIFDKALNERSREIISLRYGLTDGHDYTLEEIGQQYGLTRERIRQIEANILKIAEKHGNRVDLRDFSETTSYAIGEHLRHQLFSAIAYADSITDHTDPDTTEQRTVGRLIKRYIARARSDQLPRPSGIAGILRHTLRMIGRPTYYVTVYDKAKELFGDAVMFTKQDAYNVMFHYKGFQLHGNGVFSLNERNTTTEPTTGTNDGL